MAEFQIPKNRDAYAAILGFRYQVDWTIVRLCELPANAHLELECGEDIDIVANALTAADAGAERILEQIKHLGKRVTLRSPECAAALSNCVLHRGANPDLNLRFRFCTNAHVGIESPSPFSDRRAGIEVWRDLQTGSASDEGGDLRGIATILNSANCPPKYNRDNWAAFQEYLRNPKPDSVLELVRNFEWAVRQPVAGTLTEAVRAKLREIGLVATTEEAEQLHARLFLSVMQTLSRPGRKVLDSEFLESESKLPPLRDAERRLLSIVVAEIFTIEIQLKEIEEQVIANKASLDDAHRRIDELAAGVETNAAVVAGAELTSIAPPRQVELLIKRNTAVQELITLLRSKCWLRIRGAIGAGKSQLSLLIAQAMVGHAHWLSLRDCDETASAYQLWQFFRHATKDQTTSNIEQLVRAGVRSLDLPALLIIEDLPRVSAGSRLDIILGAIFDACHSNGVYLVTTSHFDYSPSWATQQFATSILSPSLDAQDISDLLSLHGAPETFQNPDRVQALLQHVEGHPMLAVATIRHLAHDGWSIDSSTFQSNQIGDHAAEAIETAIHRLLKSVEDSDARLLLYRLALVIGTFQEKTTLAAAGAEPPISRPRERFSAVEGLWVDRFADSHYSVSPLIRPLSDSELGSEVKQRVDEALVKELVARERLSVVDVGNAATYFHRSGHLNDAALFILFALGKAKSLPREDVIYLLEVSWFYSNIPEDVRLATKLSIRATQTSLARHVGEPIKPILDDADHLLDQGTEDDAWAKAAFLILTLYDVATIDFRRACGHARKLAQLRQPVASQLPVMGKTIGRAIWLSVSRARTTDDLKAWIECLESFDAALLNDAFRWDPAKQGCGVAINAPWQQLHLEKPNREKWLELVEVYTHVKNVADKLGLEMLRARAVAAQIIVYTEYLNDLPAAVRLAQDELRNDSLQPSNQFLIKEALGRQYLYRHENKNAIETLTDAIALNITDYPEILTRTHLEIGSILALDDPATGIRHAQISIDIAKAEPSRVSERSLIISLGEMGIACWLAQDNVGAFRAFDEAVERFFDADLDTDGWKQLLPRLGHCVSYLATLATTGEPPSYDEPSAPPHRREFLGWSEAMAEHHDERNFPVHIDAIFSSLSLLGAAVEEDERAAYWARRGFDEAVRHKHLLVMGLTGQELFTPFVIQGQVIEALDRIRQAMRANWSMHLLRQQGNPMDSSLQIEAVLGARPNERWHGAERWAIQQGLLPLLLYFGQLQLAGSNDHKSLEELESYIHGLGNRIVLLPEWEAGLTFIRKAVERTDDWQGIRRSAERWPDDSPHGLRWMGYLASTLQNNIPIEQASVLHARFGCYSERRLGARTSLERRIVVPFLESYWQDVLDNRVSSLHDPYCLEVGLSDAKSASSKSRSRIILTAALQATDAKIPNSQQAVKKWLRER